MANHSSVHVLDQFLVHAVHEDVVEDFLPRLGVERILPFLGLDWLAQFFSDVVGVEVARVFAELVVDVGGLPAVGADEDGVAEVLLGGVDFLHVAAVVAPGPAAQHAHAVVLHSLPAPPTLHLLPLQFPQILTRPC